MSKKKVFAIVPVPVLVLVLLWILRSSGLLSHDYFSGNTTVPIPDTSNLFTSDTVQAYEEAPVPEDTIKVVIGTYLGNFSHNYYGDRAPAKLEIKWKKYLGFGETVVGTRQTWYGAGWTGQPLIVTEKEKKYIIQGAYDHKLKKIEAETGNVVWEYKFDDIIKGTGTIWVNKDAETADDKFVILQGSRRGLTNSIDANIIPSYRAVSYISGKEFWRMNSKKTYSWSRDVDGSAIVLNDTAYLGLENGYFVVFDPDHTLADTVENLLQPKKLQELKLYEEKDKTTHGKNLVTESSPCLLGNRVYVTTGSGHLYGYNLKTREIDWNLYIGADMDGTPVVTEDSCLLVTFEKEYIKGRGGVFKVNPSGVPDSSVVWFFPVGNKFFAKWNGGVVGSAAVNDCYRKGNIPSIAAFSGVDGYLYIVNHRKLSGKTEKGPDGKTLYPAPELICKYKTGPSISTPIIVGNRLVAGGYNGLFLFEFDDEMNFRLLEWKSGLFEATPVADNGNLYIASRDGYLYCFGGEEEEPLLASADTVAEEPVTNEARLTEDLLAAKEPAEQPAQEKISGPVHSGESASLPEAVVKEEVKLIEKTNRNNKYHIIAGSYRTMDRTELWDDILHEKGFETTILGPKDGYYYNSVNSFATLGEAYREIIRLREAGTEQVWVLEYD
ncbi:MAG: hypothetical protein KJ607_02955 [Bacteroidetes bacterium]|nr:hypothetical protein [Bacteroidota bacterium]